MYDQLQNFRLRLSTAMHDHMVNPESNFFSQIMGNILPYRTTPKKPITTHIKFAK